MAWMDISWVTLSFRRAVWYRRRWSDEEVVEGVKGDTCCVGTVR